MGYQAGYTNTTGYENTLIGFQAGYLSTTARAITAVGYTAGYNVTTAQYGCFVGRGAGASVTTGTANNFFGVNASALGAGYYVTTGAKNTIIGGYDGNQGGLDIRTASNYIVLSDGDGNPRAYWDNNGLLTVGKSSGSGGPLTIFNNVSSTNAACIFNGSANVNGVGTGANAAATLVTFNRDSGSLRSINAAGSINASGADYAEYMTKAGDFIIAKGDVCGINAEGKLTNVFTDAITFVVKSTEPSYVGGDVWGTEEALGLQTPEHNATQEERDAFNTALETARQRVDRVAFAGQVPVNVLGATAGQYIVPVNDNGAITGQAVSNPTFEQYQSAVGKVIAIEEDGRARIIVKVA